MVPTTGRGGVSGREDRVGAHVCVCARGVRSHVCALFVDDSADEFGNAEYFHAGLASICYDATYYNAVDSAAGPSDLYMNNFDLVVWHTSSDGAELLFWNGIEEDNASLESYLNGGGNLWLVGNDFFFDRYGLAPVAFSAGESIDTEEINKSIG